MMVGQFFNVCVCVFYLQDLLSSTAIVLQMIS